MMKMGYHGLSSNPLSRRLKRGVFLPWAFVGQGRVRVNQRVAGRHSIECLLEGGEAIV